LLHFRHNTGKCKLLTNIFGFPNPLKDALIDTVRGRVEKTSIIHKFGRNDNIGTTFVPLALGGIYRTPQVNDATSLRVKAGNANDTVDGSGARGVILHGLSKQGLEVRENVPTAGTSAGANSKTLFLRLFRSYTSSSGTFSSVPSNSQAAAIVIENSAGTEDWATINDQMSQSHTAAFTVPLNMTAFILSFFTTVDGNKAHDLLLYAREGILQTVAPFSAMRAFTHVVGLTDPLVPRLRSPIGPFPELTDLIWVSKVAAGTAAVSVDFEILLHSKND